MKEQFIEIFNDHIKRPGADALLSWLEKSDFFTAPASTRFHLSEPGGLVKHSVHVYERLRELYSNELARNTDGPVILSDEDEEKIAICGLLHDICKVGCYKQEPKNQKTYDHEKVKKPRSGRSSTTTSATSSGRLSWATSSTRTSFTAMAKRASTSPLHTLS